MLATATAGEGGWVGGIKMIPHSARFPLLRAHPSAILVYVLAAASGRGGWGGGGGAEEPSPLLHPLLHLTFRVLY